MTLLRALLQRAVNIFGHRKIKNLDPFVKQGLGLRNRCDTAYRSLRRLLITNLSGFRGKVFPDILGMCNQVPGHAKPQRLQNLLVKHRTGALARRRLLVASVAPAARALTVPRATARVDRLGRLGVELRRLLLPQVQPRRRQAFRNLRAATKGTLNAGIFSLLNEIFARAEPSFEAMALFASEIKNLHWADPDACRFTVSIGRILDCRA